MKKITLILAAVLIVASCKKSRDIVPRPPSTTGDAKTVLLKEVITVRLPSPYFHFTYDSQNYVKQISFASEHDTYTVEYENKRVKKMTKLPGGNTIQYTYANNAVSEINEYSGVNGKKKFRYQINYNDLRQVTEVLWYEFTTSDTATLFKRVLLAYHEDGNLASIDRLDNSTGELKWSSRHEFSNYDTKTNVDDFYLLKDFFDTFLFLPQVKFQKTNPQREIITGGTNYFDITYTYDYNGDLPVKKSGAVLQTNGTNPGKIIQIATFFNYY